jgi:hypothetical protein
MTIKITLADLIQSLRKAAANPEAHSLAQQSYFSELQEDSVLVNCGTACCIAGDLILKAHVDDQSSQEEIDEILDSGDMDPYDWVQYALRLSNVEATLAFDPGTHYEIHLLLADLLGAGLRLDDMDYVMISPESTYTVFHWAHLEDDDVSLNLEELKEWMRSIAK